MYVACLECDISLGLITHFDSTQQPFLPMLALSRSVVPCGAVVAFIIVDTCEVQVNKMVQSQSRK